jgi:hypothetical protein
MLAITYSTGGVGDVWSTYCWERSLYPQQDSQKIEDGLWTSWVRGFGTPSHMRASLVDLDYVQIMKNNRGAILGHALPPPQGRVQGGILF